MILTLTLSWRTQHARKSLNLRVLNMALLKTYFKFSRREKLTKIQFSRKDEQKLRLFKVEQDTDNNLKYKGN
jgi:hypothetical protein